ncbi:hypothetical protein Tco_1268427 [Tanacetum coccineum]
MTFLSTTFASRFQQINNQLRTSSNPRNQATIQDGRVIVQSVQGRQTHGYTNSGEQNNRDTVIPTQASQEIPTPVAFQIYDLEAFDSNCDDVPSAKAVLMANLSSYDSNVLSKCSEQPSFDNDTKIAITSDSDIIFYEQYLQETKNPVVQNTSSSAQQDELLMSVIEEMSSQVAKCNKVQQENLIIN